jgi:hypothetical protein
MLQLLRAYGETIARLAIDYWLPAAAVVLALLAGHAVLHAVARIRVGRGPKDR